MRKHLLVVAATLVALLPLTACANTRSESSAPAQSSPSIEDRADRKPLPDSGVPTVSIGGTVTVSQEMNGPTEGVTGTAGVTVSNFAALPYPRIEKYPATPVPLHGAGYTVWVEIDTRSGEFSYSTVYFSVRTPGGDIYVASTVGLEDDLGSGTLSSGERRHGSLLFEIPSGTNLTEIVLVGTDASTPLAVWTLD